MKRFPIALTAAAAASLLSGCAGLTGLLTAPAGRDSTMGQAVLQHLELCRRTYRGALGVGITGSFEIDCPAQPAPASSPTGVASPFEAPHPQSEKVGDRGM